MSQTPLPEQVEPSVGLSSNFELMSSKDVACHMTSYDWELFNCVHEVRRGQHYCHSHISPFLKFENVSPPFDVPPA